MNAPQEPERPVDARERLELLLALSAVEPLDDRDQQDLAQLLEMFPDADRQGYEAAAAICDLAFQDGSGDGDLGDLHQLPANLRSEIESEAAAYIRQNAAAQSEGIQNSAGENSTVQPNANSSAWPVPRSAIDPTSTESGSGSPRLLGLAVAGWTLAIAASITLLFVLSRPQKDVVSPAVDLAAARQQLLAQPDTISLDWSSGTTPFDVPVSGNVVWNQARQEGYMTFVGVPPNNPSEEQFQLWIIDPERDDEPIDGGVFDIPDTPQQTALAAQDAKTIVPIRAKLPTIDPQAFAVTIEKPGGVVVSDQSRLPLLATLP